MPPAQCPSCGRFLKRSFVASLDDAPAPCPGCGTELRPERFRDPVATSGRPAPVSPMERAEAELHDPPGGAEATRPAPSRAATSVRPPDLPPSEVRGEPDVLHKWDVGVGPELDAPRPDRPPFPTDTVVVAGAGIAGLVLGLSVGRDRRAVAAASGAAAGIVAAVVARRLWRLDT